MSSLQAIAQQSVSVAESLVNDSEEALYVRIGSLNRVIDDDPSLAFAATLKPSYEQGEMGPLDALREIGKRIVRKWSKALHELVCGGDDDAARTELLKALNLGEVAAIGAVTTLLLPVLSPAIAAAVAVVIVKKFLLPAGSEICEYWDEQLAAAD